MKRFDILVIAALAATLSACRHDVDFDACGQIDAEQVTVSAEAAGRIISLDLKEGDALAAGQMVGAVDSVQTDLQISELEQRRDGAKSRLIDIEINKVEDNKWEWILKSRTKTVYSGETVYGNVGANLPESRQYFKSEIEAYNDAIVELIIII